MFVKVNPPVITDASKDDTFFLFRLYDVNTNQTIPYTTFFVAIEKGLGKDAETLMPSTLFHSENGLLKLKVQPLEDDLQIIGTQDQFLHGWLAAPNGTINIRGPIFLECGIYHVRIEILGVDDIRNTFPEDEIVKFDLWLSVGDVLTESIDYWHDSNFIVIQHANGEYSRYDHLAHKSTW